MVAEGAARSVAGRVFGPASLIGVVVGLMVQMTVPFWVPREFGWIALALPSVLGLGCCLVPGRVRHIGVGSVVSMLALPLALLVTLAVGAILHAMRY
ncbi:MAG: hypothetical protein WAX14_24300 [Rhodococcus sp. (in: high G+C Gram-positive bacteria)]|uniref:hypothetical protein n=1 Tax=Rhodococcus sp. TaxID=1831 RepID=UPI003BB634F1